MGKTNGSRRKPKKQQKFCRLEEFPVPILLPHFSDPNGNLG